MVSFLGMITPSTNTGLKREKYPMLNKELGRRLSTREVAEYLELDEDTVRKYYEQIGGIRPTGPKGRILFFEKNIVNALSRSDYAFKDNEERTNSIQGQSSEEQGNQDETIQNRKGGQKLGSRATENGLVGEDRHGIFSG
jgi:hypothetical protein